MDELSLFSLALGLSKPWRVVDLKFSKEEERLDLRIDFLKGAKFPCPSCDETGEGEVHDTQDRTWRHLNFFQYETYLHARVRCGKCGVKQVEVPWARPGSGFALLFELLVLWLSGEMSVAAVAEMTSEHANRLWRILNHYVERARRAVDLSGFHQLRTDEARLRVQTNRLSPDHYLSRRRTINLQLPTVNGREPRKESSPSPMIRKYGVNSISPGLVNGRVELQGKNRRPGLPTERPARSCRAVTQWAA